MNSNVQKKSLETRFSALSTGALVGQGVSALARGDVARVQMRENEMPSLMGCEMQESLTALDRATAGECRYCRICGADISSEHLDVHPESPFCESCSA